MLFGVDNQLWPIPGFVTITTLQRRYNAVAYNAETVITRLGRGSRFFFPQPVWKCCPFSAERGSLKIASREHILADLLILFYQTFHQFLLSLGYFR